VGVAACCSVLQRVVDRSVRVKEEVIVAGVRKKKKNTSNWLVRVVYNGHCWIGSQ